jgi:hypothetical protein
MTTINFSGQMKTVLWNVVKLTFFAAAVILLAVSCKNKKDSNKSSKPDSGTTVACTVSVTPPAGWASTPSGYTLLYYKKGANFFWVRKPSVFYNIDETVKSYKDREQEAGHNFKWGEIKHVTVNGYEAKNLYYTVSVSGVELIYDVYFICKDNNVFITVCQSSPEDYTDDLKSEYRDILNSFQIETK